jgi:hypothetical protein
MSLSGSQISWRSTADWRECRSPHRPPAEARDPGGGRLVQHAIQPKMTTPNANICGGRSAHPTFDHLITLDWYDAVVEGVARCPACQAWFYCWLIAWAPGTAERVYALRPVEIDWIERLIASFNEEPRWPRWAPRLSETSSHQSILNELGSPPRVFVGVFSDLVERQVALREVKPHELGRWEQPAGIEAIVDQSPQERSRLMGLARTKGASHGVP